MAVQAQNPSTIFLFNRIQDQEIEGMECTIQEQAGGGPSIAARKRGRDRYVNLQQQVSTGLQLSFEVDESSAPSTDLAVQIKQQDDEIDLFLRLQGEHLRRMLAESRARHYRALASAAEELAAKRLREKEAELEQARRRGAELERRVARLAAESAAWQARARAEEAAAVKLQERLRQAAADRAATEEGAPDTESACGAEPNRWEGDGTATWRCRSCGAAPASMLVLPCRHLCLCPSCDAGAATCPACSCVKSASVEVYLT